MNTPTTSTPAAPRVPDFQNGPLALAFAAVAAAAKSGLPVVITNREQITALADWHRRAWQETHSPYQCLWRDRAQTAEATVEKLRAQAGADAEWLTRLREQLETQQKKTIAAEQEIGALNQLVAELRARQPETQL